LPILYANNFHVLFCLVKLVYFVVRLP